MKKFAIICLCLFCFSCTNENESLIGDYTSVQYNVFEDALLNLDQKTTWSIGTQLKLKDDSNFKLITCGNIITGTWTVLNDSLNLNFESNRWRKDSLQEVGFEGEWPILYTKPWKYAIQGNQLIQEYSRLDSNGVRIRSLHNLLKSTTQKEAI